MQRGKERALGAPAGELISTMSVQTVVGEVRRTKREPEKLVTGGAPKVFRVH